MSSSSSKANQLLQELKAETSKNERSIDNAKVGQLLAQLKIQLSELGLLFPSVDEASKLDLNALTTAREVLEIGAFHSIRIRDVPAFERYLSLLGTFYNDLGSSLPQSSNEPPLFALSLLRLLSQNRIAEFHTLLETIPSAIIESNEINWVLKLERSLMEGSYSRVWALCSTPSQLPRQEFIYFVDSLMSTVRNEIASCDERAYDSLPLRDAQTLLFFKNENEVKAFAQSRGWRIENNGLIKFNASKTSKKGLSAAGEMREMNKEKVVGSVVAYARELESIV